MSIKSTDLANIKLKKTSTRVTGLDGSVKVENADDSHATVEQDKQQFFIMGSAAATEEEEDDSKNAVGVVEFDAGTDENDAGELQRKAQWFLSRKKFGDGFRCAKGSSKPKIGVYVIEDPKKPWESHYDHLAFLLSDEFEVIQLNDRDIREGALASAGGILAVIFPGGRIWDMDGSLSNGASEQLATFIANGGGFIGMCAGGFLATADGFSGCNGKRALVDCETSWTPGMGTATVEVTSLGAQVLGLEESKTESLFFANGPHFKIRAKQSSKMTKRKYEMGATKFELDDIQPLLMYKQVRGSSGETRVDFDGFDVAAFSGVLGEGRIIAFGPHPESSKPEVWLEPYKRSVRYASKLL
eukprot:TRINITY_DN26387_c0_g3_i1.p1 TRINITY_DN26387_c0_g3~~TRINITY_DN26387_c0_g3_i1.p1  ORF type:complete len:357 (+),score=109.97 TRINITY_DN26387_c0_g3_i1:67-1137(+)